MRESLRFLLEVHGYNQIRTAASGREALEYLAATNTPVELILTDVNMPGLNGIEVCRHVKATPHLRDIPILVITAVSDEPMLERAFAAGAHDFLPKPVGPTALIARVRAALNLKLELDRRKAREAELVELNRRLERLNAKLKRLSVLDELTGIPNRRYFNLLLRQEWGRAARERFPLSLLMIDIDNFKAFNDLYGHPAGDACLTRVARTLYSLTRRPGDAVMRFGGEEFVVLLANTDLSGAYTVADSLRAAIEAMHLQHVGSPYECVTVSLGAASVLPDPAKDSEMLVQAADRALYEAKAKGRNRVETEAESTVLVGAR
jgi:diguanylate cyclase (GGDEF)-like protein